MEANELGNALEGRGYIVAFGATPDGDDLLTVHRPGESGIPDQATNSETRREETAMLTTCARLEDIDHLLPKDDFVTIGQWGALEVSRRGPTEGRDSYIAVTLNGWGPGFVLTHHRHGEPDGHYQADTPDDAAKLAAQLI